MYIITDYIYNYIYISLLKAWVITIYQLHPLSIHISSTKSIHRTLPGFQRAGSLWETAGVRQSRGHSWPVAGGIRTVLHWFNPGSIPPWIGCWTSPWIGMIDWNDILHSDSFHFPICMKGCLYSISKAFNWSNPLCAWEGVHELVDSWWYPLVNPFNPSNIYRTMCTYKKMEIVSTR